MKSKDKKYIYLLVLSIAITSLISFGILGIGRSGESGFDGAYLYAAGRAWLSGKNPYDHQQLLQSVAGLAGIPQGDTYFLRDFFAYPPQVAFFSIPLGLLSYPASRVVLVLLNLISLGGITAATFYTIHQFEQTITLPPLKGAKWIMAAVIVGNPFTTHVIWMGQTTLIAFAATMLAWTFSLQKRWVWAGVFLGIASFKPQICLLLILWFVFERHLKILLVSLGTATLMSSYPFLTHGLVKTLQEWYWGLQNYKSSSFNAVDVQNNHVVGLESLLHTAGFPSPNLSFLGIAIVLGVWVFRKKLNSLDILGILMAISLTLVYAHDYDYVCLIPTFTSLALYSYRSSTVLFGNVFLVLLLFFPQRLVRIFNFPALNHWRTIVILFLLLVSIYLSFKWKHLRLKTS